MVGKVLDGAVADFHMSLLAALDDCTSLGAIFGHYMPESGL